MASADSSLIMRDHLYSLDDRLRRGRPPPLLKSVDEDIIIDGESALETTPVIDPASISRCCIERGLFPAVPLFFQYPCGTSKGWSEWVDHELKDLSTCDVLSRAGVLDAIFISKACNIHIEAKMLRHVVRRWSTETHTFVCSWGEFTPTLEDVANILHLPLCGSQDPFHIALTPEDKLKLETLRKGAPTSPSTSLRFSNWIQFFGDVNKNEPCRLAAFISLWLGRFIFCDFSQDCLHERVFPLALAITHGRVLPLAPMFLGHLYCLLDQVQFLERGVAGTMAIETFLNSSFLQVFLWERFRGVEVSPLPYSRAKTLAESNEGSYVPESLPLICRWSRRMQRKGQNFLRLLDDVESFIFRPYCALSEGFKRIPLYADSDDLVGAPVMTAQGRQLRREALLSAACLPLPTLGDDYLEVSVHYSSYRVRRQLGFDQGVPSSPNHVEPSSLHRTFWTRDNVSGGGRPLTLALAIKGRVGGLSKAYQSYWNRCFTSFSRFHAAPCDRLLPTIVHHARLVSEEKAISLSEKRNLPFTSKSGEVVGDFSKLKQKLEKSGSLSARKNVAHGKRKREESYNIEKKKQAVKESKKFIPKVAASGPPNPKRDAPLELLPQQQLVASGSNEGVGMVLEASSSLSIPKTQDKGKETLAILKCRSMRIRQTRFASSRKGKGEGSGPKVVVTVDDDEESDENADTETGISTHEQESIHGASDMNEDLDEDQYYSRDEGTYSDFDTHLEELDASNMPHAFASDHERHVDIEPVMQTIEGTTGGSPETGLSLLVIAINAMQAVGEVTSILQGAEDILPSPPLGELGIAASTSSQLPAVHAPTSSCLGMPDTVAGTSSQLPAVLLPTSSCPDTPVIVAGSSSQRPTVPPLIPPFPITSVTAADTSSLLSTAPLPTSSCPDTPVTAAGTSSQLPAVLRGEIIDARHKNSDASYSAGHLSEKNISWRDWENSFMAFKAFFDGGVTILRSIDELLPLCHRFNGYATFQGALIYPETIEVLRKFMDKHGSFMEVTDVTSSFSRCTALRALGLVLHGMDTMQLLDITDHRLLCWRDAICEAIILGFRVDFLLNLVKNLACAVFGARAIHSMQLLHDSDEVKAAADALNLKQRELENQRQEVHALLLTKGISADNAECVTEAAARSSLRASVVLFGHSP